MYASYYLESEHLQFVFLMIMPMIYGWDNYYDFSSIFNVHFPPIIRFIGDPHINLAEIHTVILGEGRM